MECPCENCIVFVMCKHRLMEEENPQVVQLSKTCAHLQDYILEVSTNNVKLHTIEARKVFGLINWGDNEYEEMPSVG